jgi:hypothetical protein
MSPFRLSRPMSINHELAWQNTIDGHDDKSSPSPTPSPRPSGLTSIPLAPVRWSRGSMGNGYTTLGSSQDLSKGEGEEKDCQNALAVSVEFKGLRSDTTIFSPEAGPSMTGEVPKVAIRRGLRGNWTKLAPHILAIAVTSAVVQLSFRDAYWMDLEPPDKEIVPSLTQGSALNFLQLAAKLHELLILASLSSIVLHAVQAHLTGNTGLPLGMISNAFELGSGEFLRRKSFWSSWWSSDQVSGRRFPFMRFWLLSLLSTLLVTLSGPSSAIAVIPTLNYFGLSQPFDETVLPYYVFNQSTELWPQQLTAASLNAPNSGIPCTDADSESTQEICPVGGFRDTYNWAGSLLISGDSDSGTNISFPDSTGDRRRVLTAQSCNSTFDGRASAVSLNAFISGAMTAYWTFAQKNFKGIALESAQPRINLDADTMIFAPRVEVMCNGYSNYHFNPKKPNDQPNMTFPTFGGSGPIPVPDWSYKYARPLNASNFTFVEIPNTNPLSPSIGAVLTNPLIENINGTWVQTTENMACSLYSQWIPVDAWYEPTTNDQVSYKISTDMSESCLALPADGSSGRQPINTTISAAYANAINQPIVFVVGNIPALEAIFQRYIFTDSQFITNGSNFRAPIPGKAGVVVTDAVARQERAKLISTVLAGVVTDGIARNAGNGEFPYAASMFLLPNRTDQGGLQGRFPVTSATGGEDDPLNTTNIADKEKWLRLNPTVQRYGYGYRWHGSRTTQFGISVLLVHLAIAITHTVFVLNEILGRGRGIHRGWETIPEMIALAMNSRPSEGLRNTCAGISQARTWGEAVGVRETSEGHLEVVVGRNEMEQMALPRAGVRYGALPQPQPQSGVELHLGENMMIKRRFTGNEM